LTQQFQSIAAHALKDAGGQAALDAGQQMASAFTQEALKTASGVVAQTAAMASPVKKAAPAKAAAPRKAAAAGTAKPDKSVAAPATPRPVKAARKPTPATGRTR
jgi:type IV secretory pathway TrbL component